MAQLTLRREDVDIGSTTLRVGGRHRLRQSRALDRTELTVAVTHKDTGLSLKAAVGPGHYSKVELRRRRERCVDELLRALAPLVAQRRRLPGQ